MDKHYLRDLSARGVEVVPTTYVDRPASSELLQEILATEAEAFVVKPAVGATAFQCRRVSRKRISSELTDLDPARSSHGYGHDARQAT